MKRLLIVAALALVPAGCGGTDYEAVPGTEPAPTVTDVLSGYCGPQAERPPCGPGVEPGARYEFTLYTHCGIEYARFDGRWWLADPPLDDGSHNPPRGWGNPSQPGTMELVAPDRAKFRAEELSATFRPAPASYEPPGCA
ncbi:MAG: hypothetical protein ABR583_05500 [Gaiellaceae bacterium]